MPSVTKNEGIRKRVTNKPLHRPIAAAVPKTRIKPTSIDVAPVLYRVHMSTGQNPNNEPTERSNSPAVISRVMASAISPSSTVKASMLPMLSTDRNAGLICQKTKIMATSRTNGPNSGLDIMRCITAFIYSPDRMSS